MRLLLYPLAGFMLFAAACRNLSGASRQLPLKGEPDMGEAASRLFAIRSRDLLIIEFLLELCYNAVLYGKHIGLDEQSLVGLHSRDEILPVFKSIQPVFARAIDL